MNIDFTSLFAGISLTAVAGWVSSFIALRKDERAVEIEQITKERTKWRDNMRKLTEEIVSTYYDNDQQADPKKVAIIRARLATSLNPKCEHDKDIVQHFDDLFSSSKKDIDVFVRRIAMLLKHDWERVKWDCLPIYMKLWDCLACGKRRAWRVDSYRDV